MASQDIIDAIMGDYTPEPQAWALKTAKSGRAYFYKRIGDDHCKYGLNPKNFLWILKGDQFVSTKPVAIDLQLFMNGSLHTLIEQKIAQ